MIDEPGKKTKVVDSKWVLKLKFGADGDVERFKTRFVALWLQTQVWCGFLREICSAEKDEQRAAMVLLLRACLVSN